jgi:hypothetical protein
MRGIEDRKNGRAISNRFRRKMSSTFEIRIIASIRKKNRINPGIEL